DAQNPAARCPLGGAVEVHHLGFRMHAGVGTPGAHRFYGSIGHPGKRVLEETLHTFTVALTLPAVIGRPVVFNSKCDAHTKETACLHALRGRGLFTNGTNAEAECRVGGRASQDCREQGCSRKAPMDGFTAFLGSPPTQPMLRGRERRTVVDTPRPEKADVAPSRYAGKDSISRWACCFCPSSPSSMTSSRMLRAPSGSPMST